MPDTFSPALAPSVGSAGDAQPRVTVADFGDGYSQRTPNGLNALDHEIYNLTWNVLDTTAFEAIRDFLKPKLKVTAFLWTAPGDASAKTWICDAFRPAPLEGDLWSLSVSFKRVFDL